MMCCCQVISHTTFSTQVPGSPLTVEVGESGLASVKGAGLEGGAVDTPLIFTVDGRGLLGEPHVTVDGPDSVARVNVRKQDEGLYQVSSKGVILEYLT